MKRLMFLFFLLIHYVAAGSIPTDFNIDSKDEIDGVSLVSGKKDDVRFYQGKMEMFLEKSIDDVLAAVLDFGGRCNNEHADRRKFWDKKRKCDQHNANLIESVVISKFEKPNKKQPELIHSYIVLRRIYNRELFQNYDLIEVYKNKKDGLDSYTVKQRMITDDEAKKYMEKPLERESAFLASGGEFVMKKVSATKTKLSYTYHSKTDHWLLNKSIVSGRVFSAVAESLDILKDAIVGLAEKAYLRRTRSNQ